MAKVPALCQPLPMDQLIQIIGALLVLAAFAAVQFDRMRPDSQRYLTLNLIGSTILTVLALVESQWGFFLLEGRLGDRLGSGVIRRSA